jgi:Fe2+ transport system protein FeoA
MNNDLSTFKVGEKGKVIGLSKANRVYRQKLLAMGLTPGTHFVVNRMAPLGDPIELMVRGYGLSLRKREAAILEVTKELA